MKAPRRHNGARDIRPSPVKSSTIRRMQILDLDEAVALLKRTPAALEALLRGLPETWTRRNEGEDTWSVLDVIDHLSHCEREDWMPRIKILLGSGEERTFEPLDRLPQLREVRSDSVEQALERFARLRSKKLDELSALNLQQTDFKRRGRHPEFGAVTLAELLATWATHDLTHLHQISRIMAHQYRDAVGPWRRYLGVLHCTGRSSSA